MVQGAGCAASRASLAARQSSLEEAEVAVGVGFVVVLLELAVGGRDEG